MTEPASYELITLIKHLAIRTHQSIDALLKPYDLARSQYVMLYRLAKKPSMGMAELADVMAVEPATLSGIAATLQAKGLVERITRHDDKRRKDLRLTAVGKQLLASIPPPGPLVERTLLDGLSPENKAVFKAIGYQMIENLERELEKRAGQDDVPKA